MLDNTIPKIEQKVITIETISSVNPCKRETLEVYTCFAAAKAPGPDIHRDEAKTILLLPGLDDSVFLYEKAIDLIRSKNPEWSVLGIDLRGQGKTCDQDRSTSIKPISLDQQEDIIKKVTDSYQLTSMFIVGLSYGAGISLHFAGHNPEKVLGLGLIAPYVSEFKTYKPGLPGLYYFLTFLNPLTPKLTPYSLPFYFFNARLKGRLNPNVKWTPKKMKALTRLTLGILRLNTDETLDELAHLPAGVHLMCACQDSVVPIGAHRHFYNRIPASMEKSFSLEDGIGHRVLSEHPRQAAQWLNRILPL